MNFPGYNPSMLNNMNMDQMKMASDMLSGMSDEQLAGYAKMMGMPNMDPSMLRNSAGMMKGMNEHQFSQMKDQAKNFKPPGGFSAGSPSASSTTPTNSTPSTSTNQSTATSSRYGHIEKLKNKGNDLFKKGSYGEAATAYFEAIIEIEEIRSGKGSKADEELDNLEVSCRLNYANVKAKENEYDVVLTQAKAVLKVKESGKAYFRLGQALYHFKKYEEALKNLETAITLLPGDDTVVDYRNKARKEIEANKAQTATENKPTKEENDVPSASTVKEEKSAQEDTTTKPKMKKKNAPEVDVPITEKKPTQSKVEPAFDYLGSQNEEKEQPKEEKKEVLIEEEKVTETKPSTTSSSRTTPTTYPGGLTEDKIKQGQEQLGNMNPDQMKMMADYFKNMDNASLKSMLKMQSGMDVSDEQLQSMKMMMTPEMLQNFSKMDLNSMPKFPNQPAPSTATTTAASASTGSTTTATAQPQAQPNFPMGGMGGMGGMAGAGGMPNIDMGSDQIQAMLDMAIKNPEMLKNMVGMLGEDNPVAKMLKNKSPETLATYLKIAQKLLKVYGKVSPLVRILRKYWQLLAGVLIAYIVFRIAS